MEGSRIVGEQFGVHYLLYLYDESGAPIGLQHRTSSYAAGVFDTYYFEKNVFGDVIGVYTADGTPIGTYKYDAWGNCTRVVNTNATTAQKQIFNTYNPFRYRGYYYDVETALYYLQSRYYDPSTGRFINADGVIAGVGSSIQGYNLFAYCFNNPVNMQDNDGAWPSWNDLQSGLTDAVDWVNNNIVQPVVDFVENVVEDFNNYDSNNQSEDVVFSSNYFSNYKGKLVIKTPFDASFSFGFIGLSVYQQNSDTLRHEYGHTIQMENMGMGRYIIDVAIPSMTINMLDRQDKLPYDYYSYPWEAEANQLGGSTLSQEGKTPLPQGGYTSYWDLIQLFFD